MGDIRTLQKYHALLRPYLAVFLASIIFDIAVTTLGLAMPLFTRVLFDYAYAFRDLRLLNTTIAIIVVVYFLYFFLDVVSQYLQIYVNQGATASLTERVFHAIQCLPLKFHQEKKSGDLLIRITDDVNNTIGMVANVLPTVIIDGGRLLMILVIALSINPKLTLLALLSIPLYIMEAKFFGGRLAAVERESIEADSNILSRAQERLSNIKTVKAFGQEQNETLSFGMLIRRRYRVAIKSKFLETVQTFANSVTLQMWTVFLMWFLGYQVVQGSLTIGEVVALMLYFEQLGDPIRSFINLFTDWKTSLVSMHRLDDVLEVTSEEASDGSGKPLKLKGGEVVADDLSFEYAPDQEVLHDISVRFPPRSITAIVGTSGSGKTTFVNLLLRFFEPTDGIIFIDGQDICEARIHELRNKVGIVTQDVTLFDGTVMDNILYGNEDKNRGDAMQAARLTGASNFIERLHGGYDTQVGQGGSLLSSGQCQRIAIARTLLRNPSVVILDEATSALDAESEFHIQEVVSKLRHSKTVIVIAHRLSTVKAADNILVLEDGRFVEEGKFEELIEKKGAFYKFYWRQFGGLANFRQQLTLELERSTRYGSKFCLAVLKVRSFHEIKSCSGIGEAEKYMEAVDYLIKKQIRMGDNCAILDGDTILMLLPEINTDQLERFFSRMLQALPAGTGTELPYPIRADDLSFTGTHISRIPVRTPEELLSALKNRADQLSEKTGYTIVDVNELLKLGKKVEKP